MARIALGTGVFVLDRAADLANVQFGVERAGKEQDSGQRRQHEAGKARTAAKNTYGHVDPIVHKRKRTKAPVVPGKSTGINDTWSDDRPRVPK